MFRAVLRRAVARLPVHLVTTGEQCQAVVEKILSTSHTSVAVDCEGAQLGRFGRASVVQLATEREVFLFDIEVGGSRVMEPLQSVLENRELVKVFHDCREDASVLLHQHSTLLAGVFDTQVAFSAWLERRGLELYQAGIAEVLRTFSMAAYRSHRWDILERKTIMPHRWLQRPLDPEAIRYAVEGVAHLLPLQRALCRSLGDPAGDLVLRRSVHYLEYAQLNYAELPTSDLSSLRPGTPLQAMLATKRPDSAYFKLNTGTVTGAVLDSKDLRDFVDLQPGDLVACRVKSISECGQFIHLQREGHGNLFFDERQRVMMTLPPREEAERAFPSRQSSLYGFGTKRGGSAPINLEPVSYREQRSEVIHKIGKRGSVKVRKTGFTPPKRQADA